MRILLTGAKGFIGTNLKEYLSKKYTVTGIDKDEVDLADSNTWVRHETLMKYMKDIDVVIHCAGYADVRNSYLEVDKQFDGNIVTTKTVLQCMVDSGVKNLIYLSTAVVNCSGNEYFDTQTTTFHPELTEENEQHEPVSMYGTVKLMAEQLIRGYVRNFDLRAMILRLENIVGPHYHHGILVDLIEKLENDSSPLEVLGNGSQLKSYLHIDDLCHIVCSSIKEIQRRAVSTTSTINVGNLDFITVKSIVNIVCEEMQLRPPIHYGVTNEGFKGDIPIIGMCKNNMLYYCKKPKYTSDVAIRKTVRWILNEKER